MESTLNLPRKALLAHTGKFLGYGRGADYSESAWTVEQQRDIEEMVDVGQRLFYHPPAINGEIYEWSFLKPVLAMTLAKGNQVLDLPDDFASLAGNVVFGEASGGFFMPVPVIGVNGIYTKYSVNPNAAGRPTCVCQEPMKARSASGSQRWQMHFFPKADANYALQVHYNILPSAIDERRPYCYGGMAHAETLKAACLAAAEQDIDNARGPQWAYFLERVVASIARDRLAKAHNFGYCGDHSDSETRNWAWNHGIGTEVITIGGLTPS